MMKTVYPGLMLAGVITVGCGGAYSSQSIGYSGGYETSRESRTSESSYAFSDQNVSGRIASGESDDDVDHDRVSDYEVNMPASEPTSGGASGMGDAAPALQMQPGSYRSTSQIATPPEATAVPPQAPPVEPAGPATDVQTHVVIYTASLWVAVYNVDEARTALRQLIEARHGYISQEADQQVTLRIPVRELDATISAIAHLGDIQHRQMTSQDVTEEYQDLGIRIRNLRVVRERLEAILATARTIEDTIRVETELRRITEELERLEGRIRYLTDRASMSTINVTFSQSEGDRPQRQVPLPFPWLDQLGLSHLLDSR